MGRHRENFEWEVPAGVVEIVRAICADYRRREHMIKFSSISGDTLAEYIRLNEIVDSAIGNAEKGIRGSLLADIVRGKGYDSSMASPYLAKNTYYARKRKIVYDIAVQLRLV